MTTATTAPRRSISGFQDKYRSLSNFHPAPITFDLEAGDRSIRVKAPTAEHAYQASKAAAVKDGLTVLNCATPGAAKRAGRRIRQRPDWATRKTAVMRRVVQAKFRQNSQLARQLLATGDAQLVEGNNWGDTFWGVYHGRGQNRLGKILMNVRDELAAAGG